MMEAWCVLQQGLDPSVLMSRLLCCLLLHVSNSPDLALAHHTITALPFCRHR